MAMARLPHGPATQTHWPTRTVAGARVSRSAGLVQRGFDVMGMLQERGGLERVRSHLGAHPPKTGDDRRNGH